MLASMVRIRSGKCNKFLLVHVIAIDEMKRQRVTKSNVFNKGMFC